MRLQTDNIKYMALFSLMNDYFIFENVDILQIPHFILYIIIIQYQVFFS